MSHSIEGLIDILHQQIETLVEESKKTSDTETKIRIAGEIDRIAETIIRIAADYLIYEQHNNQNWKHTKHNRGCNL